MNNQLFETVYSYSVELDKTKPDSVKDVMVELRLLWEELISGIKSSDAIDRSALSALKMSSLLINFVNWFGEEKYKPLKDYISKRNIGVIKFPVTKINKFSTLIEVEADE